MKNWIKINLTKISLALGLIGSITGVTGLIVGSIAHNNTNKINNINYFLDHDYTVKWGGYYMVL